MKSVFHIQQMVYTGTFEDPVLSIRAMVNKEVIMGILRFMKADRFRMRDFLAIAGVKLDFKRPKWLALGESMKGNEEQFLVHETFSG